VDAVIVATPHHLHAQLVLQALAAGKPIFVEKPLAITWEQFGELRSRIEPDAPLLVGFNRRFSPHTAKVRELLQRRQGAAVVVIRVNAGPIARESWIHDREIGGGRLIGEGCHFIDLCAALLDVVPTGVATSAVGAPDADAVLEDNFMIVVKFGDGSIGTVVYTSKGDFGLPKERVEVFCDGQSAVIDDFNRTEIFVNGRRRSVCRKPSAKGHSEELAAFLDAVRTGRPMPLAVADLLATTAATLAAADSLRAGGREMEVHS